MILTTADRVTGIAGRGMILVKVRVMIGSLCCATVPVPYWYLSLKIWNTFPPGSEL